MLPFQRTFISSYPKATQDTQPNRQQLSVAIVEFSGITVSQARFRLAENTLLTNFHNSHRQRNVGGNLKKQLTTKNIQENEAISNCKIE